MSRLDCTLLALLALGPSLHAQTTDTGRIEGIVREAQGGVLPGATVRAESPKVPRGRITTTDAVGRYRFDDLPAGDYVIRATLPGFASVRRPNVALRAGITLAVDIEMMLGSFDEVITVTHEAPLLDTRNGGHTVNVGGDLLRSMPTSERREWFGAVTLAPGVTTAEWTNNQKLLYVHGADATANIVQIDGADMTSPALSYLSYIGVSTDAIDDVQIKTAGVDASSPLGVGGVINIATASGTNAARGAATVFAQPRAWNDSNTSAGTSAGVNQTQLDLSLGSPLVKDRLWAFGAYRYTDVQSGISRTATQLEALRGLIPGFVPFDSINEAHLWFAKLNAQLSPSQQLAGFYQYDVNPIAFADAVTEHRRKEATGGMGASLRLSSVWSNALATRLSVSYNDKRRDVRNTVADQPLQRVYQGTVLSGSSRIGNGRLVDRGSPLTGGATQPNSKLTIALDATVFKSGRSGSHEIQTGVYAQPRIQVGQEDFYPNGGYVFEEAVLRQPGVYDTGVVPFHRVFLDDVALTRVRRRGQDYALYVQDVWRPWSRLTINAGLRVDWVTWHDQLFAATSQRSADVGPRFAISYALTAAGRDVLKAHRVRVHDQPAVTGASVGSASLGQRDLYDLNLDGTFETAFITPPTFTVTPGRSFDADLHQPFIQEWGAGYSKQLAGGVAANVDLLRRDYRDRGTLLETNGRYDGARFVGYLDEGFNEIYQVTNNAWNWPVYKSLELSATKRTTRLRGIASYVRQWRHLEGTWQPHDPASFIQPLAFTNDKGIGSPAGTTSSPTDANSLSGTHMTQRSSGSAQWQDHVVRVGLVYRAPLDVLLGSNYTFQSGAWSGPIVDRLPESDPTFGPPTIILSNGRSVTNPLSTVFRFTYSTRGDRQLKTPKLHTWNLRVGRRFALRRLTLDTSLDVFNVTNHGADTSFEGGATQTFNPLYGVTTLRQPPRSAQAVIRAAF